MVDITVTITVTAKMSSHEGSSPEKNNTTPWDYYYGRIPSNQSYFIYSCFCLFAFFFFLIVCGKEVEYRESSHEYGADSLISGSLSEVESIQEMAVDATSQSAPRWIR
ncbi:hypothetical protein ASPWEDRAFT_42118 [Aspergillus wentii DTO 134E9]|uniref:Uncharacterized protein n=1 Tax=Aspergillus wentii DTO 134E9 TaxID=1073089 RepID=A0A1L9RH14_ASPWE|nr:uncharacterized protein ASPWEDRAFT_42118 [Aspergillus wentii DTO 134E9]OJJ34194.1 hypothetical protein ASPWEDRAFT_42118 [Aspergillus wentii DTO 134E9]